MLRSVLVLAWFMGCTGILAISGPLAAAEKADETPAPLPPAKSPAELEKEGFRPLIDKDLSQWKLDDEACKHWQVADGVVHYDGKGQDVWARDSFGDCVLMVDWRLPAPGDSGVFVRGHWDAQVNIVPHTAGHIFGYVCNDKLPAELRKACSVTKDAAKPVGQWNRFLITVKGDQITVVLNGQEVVAPVALPKLPKRGPVGLQNHGNPLDFANIYIKELK